MIFMGSPPGPTPSPRGRQAAATPPGQPRVPRPPSCRVQALPSGGGFWDPLLPSPVRHFTSFGTRYNTGRSLGGDLHEYSEQPPQDINTLTREFNLKKNAELASVQLETSSAATAGNSLGAPEPAQVVSRGCEDPTHPAEAYRAPPHRIARLPAVATVVVPTVIGHLCQKAGPAKVRQ